MQVLDKKMDTLMPYQTKHGGYLEDLWLSACTTSYQTHFQLHSHGCIVQALEGQHLHITLARGPSSKMGL